MAPPGLVAGLVAATERGQRREIATSAWAKLVDGAGNHHCPDLPAQGHAAPWRGGCATHAGTLGADGFGQPGRHPAAGQVIDFRFVK